MKKKSAEAKKAGLFALVLTIVVIAIAVLVNVLAGNLPASLSKIDISKNKLFTLTADTKVVLSNLEDDVTIYWVSQSGSEDSYVEILLDKYMALSDHITVEKVNPDIYPTFYDKYNSETTDNNTLVVESEKRFSVVPGSDLYTENYNGTKFNGESNITSAIDFVTRDNMPKLYFTSGHGEATASDTLLAYISRMNYEYESVNLVADGVPEDADCIFIYAPTTDFSEDEVNALFSYVIDDGGNLFVCSGPSENGNLENLNILLEFYGVYMADGLMVETNSSYYAYYPVYLLPAYGDSEILEPLEDSDYLVVIPMAGGIVVTDDENGGIGEVEQLLFTTDQSYCKEAGFNLTTYEQEENDIVGPLAVSVCIADDTAEVDMEGKIIWVASNYFLDDTYNSWSSNANVEYTVNSLAYMIGETDRITIKSKEVTTEYLTIPEEDASRIKLILIGIVPAILVVYAVLTVIDRKRQK